MFVLLRAEEIVKPPMSSMMVALNMIEKMYLLRERECVSDCEKFEEQRGDGLGRLWR
jgi:hypothetical protein